MLWMSVYREHVWDHLWEGVLFYNVGPRVRTQVTTADPTAGSLNLLNLLTSSQSVLSISSAVRVCVLPPPGWGWGEGCARESQVGLMAASLVDFFARQQ